MELQLRYRISLSVFLCVAMMSLHAQPVLYRGNPFTGNPAFMPLQTYDLNISILHESPSGRKVYSEKQTVTTDKQTQINVKIGNGILREGQIDSLIWSDGAYFLVFETDTSGKLKKYVRSVIQLRAPSDVNPGNLEGFVSDDSAKGYGVFDIPHHRNRRPRKITIDLTTSYINIDYKGGNYPIYRHYEWYDENRDGTGNSFMLTYSDKTCHEFFGNSTRIGEVKLYEEPFQELWLRQCDENNIRIELTKPRQIDNLNITYAIKGPWKIIYLIEW